MLPLVNLDVVHSYNACYTVYPLVETAQEELILPSSMALKGRTIGKKPGHVAQCLLPNLCLQLLIPDPMLVTNLK